MSSICPYCKNTGVLILKSWDINWTRAPGPFNYYRCTACHLIFLDPVPGDLSSYYDSTYYHVPSTIEQVARSAKARQYRIELIRRYVPTGHLLEIGSSYGEFAYLAHQAGFDTQVIERDARSCRFIQEQLGIRAINSDNPLEALNAIGMVDVIALWHVIEHVPRIWDVLSASAMHLSPNGILVIATPNPDAFQFKLFRGLWAHLDAPRHLYLLPVSLLTNHLRAYGLEPIAVDSDDQETAMNEDFGWKKSIMNLVGITINASPSMELDNNRSGQEPARSVSYKLARWLVRSMSTILMRISHPMISRQMQGSSYTIVFQKQPTP